MNLLVATFYKFVRLPDFSEKQAPLLSLCQKRRLKGTILLASEGINGTICGSPPAVAAVLAYLRCDRRLADLEVKESSCESPPFKRLKVRLKQEIVTLGVAEADPNQQVGTYVSPQDWNALICDSEVVTLDTRNRYEVAIGTFKGAQNPQIDSFRQFPDYVREHLDPRHQQKVALFCTGGIRCEKATSYLLSQGFKQVYHLKGGILKYLAEIPPQESLWQGECFVFDERIALQHGLIVGSYDMCRRCGHPLAEADKTSPQYQEGISCPFCGDKLSEQKKGAAPTEKNHIGVI